MSLPQWTSPGLEYVRLIDIADSGKTLRCPLPGEELREEAVGRDRRLLLREVADAIERAGAHRPGDPPLGRLAGAGKHARVERPGDLQHRHGDPPLHGLAEPAALATKLGAAHPAVVLQRAVRDAAHHHGGAVPGDGVDEVRRLRPLRTGAVSHERLDLRRAVAGEPAFRRDGRLRAEDVPERAGLVVRLAAQGGPEDLPAQCHRVRAADAGHRADQSRVERGDGPRQHAAPPVADQVRAGLAERLDEPADVAGEGPGVVAAGWLVGVAVAAQVDGDRAVAGVGQRAELVAPRPPEAGEAVQEQDQRTLTGLGDVQADAVRVDVTVHPGAVEPAGRRVGAHDGGQGRAVQGRSSRPGSSSPRWRSAATVLLAESIVRCGARIRFNLRMPRHTSSPTTRMNSPKVMRKPTQGWFSQSNVSLRPSASATNANGSASRNTTSATIRETRPVRPFLTSPAISVLASSSSPLTRVDRCVVASLTSPPIDWSAAALASSESGIDGTLGSSAPFPWLFSRALVTATSCHVRVKEAGRAGSTRRTGLRPAHPEHGGEQRGDQ